MSVSVSSVDRALRILHRAFDLALHSSLSLEPFVAGQVAYRLSDLAFGLVDDLCLPPLVHHTQLSVLLPQNLLDLTDLFLHFAGYLFIGTPPDGYKRSLRIKRGGPYIASTDTDLDPFPMHRACGKCLLSRRPWWICLLPLSANNHPEWSRVWIEILAPPWKANARWFFPHQFSFGVRQSSPHSLVLQFLQAAGQALCRFHLQAYQVFR